jgi:hypothetical protein
VFCRHQDLSHDFVLHGTDKAFNYSNAAVLTDGTVPGFDSPTPEPEFKAIGSKYSVLVAN